MRTTPSEQLAKKSFYDAVSLITCGHGKLINLQATTDRAYMLINRFTSPKANTVCSYILYCTVYVRVLRAMNTYV
jgi:hypothetical protein